MQNFPFGVHGVHSTQYLTLSSRAHPAVLNRILPRSFRRH